MRHVIILPDLGQTTNEATIRQFLKKPGERVTRGEPILAVSTDKVEMEVESFANGYLRQWLAEEGTLASAMSALAIVTDTLDEPYTSPQDDGKSAPATPVKTEEKPAGAPPAKNTAVGVTAAPAARTLAKDRGIDLSKVSGTGADGLITKADVLRWVEHAGRAMPAPTSTGDNRALAAMAATVVASKRDIPHFYAVVDVSVSHAAAWRAGWNEQHPRLHATYNDLFVLCAARSLRDNPRLNVSYGNGSYQQRSAADVLLVVAHEPTMLLVPVADPSELAWDVFLETMRKAPQLSTPVSAEPLLAISNLGMFGVKQFAAIIPPTCTSALAIGAVREQPVVKKGKLENELVCSMTISADHRVVDGVAAARFLERVQFHLNSL
jgi:pyruvate dehydrogenase E2 component (dihydrolipoamide acetyltransferase)